MNSWKFETCRRQHNWIKSVMENVCILLVIITHVYQTARFKKRKFRWPACTTLSSQPTVKCVTADTVSCRHCAAAECGALLDLCWPKVQNPIGIATLAHDKPHMAYPLWISRLLSRGANQHPLCMLLLCSSLRGPRVSRPPVPLQPPTHLIC